MKEKDLVKNLDNLIIDGLIKEAEQDNADFEAAMRKMSDEEFIKLIYEPAYADEEMSSHIAALRADSDFYENQGSIPHASVVQKSKWKVLRPWITSAIAAAAIILIVLVPSVNSMNGKLCDSALYASTEYITSSRSAADIYTSDINDIKTKLPVLEKRYYECIKKDGKFTYYIDLKEAGWDLTVAYLKLHKKGDAIKVLSVLSEQFKDNLKPFGAHCKTMLEHLQ